MVPRLCPNLKNKIPPLRGGLWASDLCYVKKVFLVLDMELWKWHIFIMINISCKSSWLNELLFLSEQFEAYFFSPEFFLVKNNSQGTENTKLPLLKSAMCSIYILAKLWHWIVLVLSITAAKVYFYRTYWNVLRVRPVL